MSLFIASLNSGSNGNCYYIGSHQDAILIDAGISCLETEKRMKRSGLNMDNVRAIFVSHEHTDHIKGIPVLAKKYQLPVYITPDTLRKGGLLLNDHLINSFQPYQPVAIGALSITAFPKVHDAIHPHSFIISCGGVTVGVFTDLGIACNNLIKHFSQCHAAFLEANYDEEMLDKGRYPWHLKNRIRGGQGHLSNKQALELFITHRSPWLSHLLLAHLSRDNNRPELVHQLFSQHAGPTQIIVASRDAETAVYFISSDAVPVSIKAPKGLQSTTAQYSLF